MAPPGLSLRNIASVHFTFSPLSPSSRSARLLLSRLAASNPTGGSSPEVSASVLPSAPSQGAKDGSGAKDVIEVTYTDKKKVTIDPAGLKIGELMARVDAHARSLRLAEEGL